MQLAAAMNDHIQATVDQTMDEAVQTAAALDSNNAGEVRNK